MPGILRRDVPTTARAFSFVDVESQAAEILATAQREAAELLARTRAQALAAAQREAEEIRKHAAAEGRTTGHEQARREAAKTAQLEARQQITKLTHALSVALTEFDLARRQLLAAAETQVIRLAVALAQRVCRRQFAGDPTVLLEMLKPALELVRHEEDVELRMSATDAELLRGIDSEFAGKLNALAHVKLVEVAEAARGACQLRTRSGQIDASLDVQLERVAEALLSGPGTSAATASGAPEKPAG